MSDAELTNTFWENGKHNGKEVKKIKKKKEGRSAYQIFRDAGMEQKLTENINVPINRAINRLGKAHFILEVPACETPYNTIKKIV